ncbi:FAD-dependent oxidoreductase [Polaromonas sp. P1(28)-13]|nr:FAD-dependent oxidoreductase [Polaromonas sp. P1(28)-13]
MCSFDRIVIIGGGHAGAQLCAALAAAGLASSVDLVCEENEWPYHRPPLSKGFLKSTEEKLQLHRAPNWFSDAGIKVHRTDPAVAIDRTEQRVRLLSGAVLPYKSLILATGARSRRLPHVPGDLLNVATVRTAADAVRLRESLHRCQTLTVIGGGFIGLEVAASARALGRTVQVLESAPRLLARSVSPEVAAQVLDTHREQGTDVRVGVAVGGFDVADGRLRTLTVDGMLQEVDLTVLGIGAVPEHALASDAGLHCENGIVVDSHMRTSDPAILAIGDCASFPEMLSGRHLRLESVQNANDQARTAAATLSGQLQPYVAVPWFWSDQGSLRLQITGLMPADGVRRRRNGATPSSFSVLHYVGERLACVESVNAPMDHLAARKLLEAGRTLPPEVACDSAVPLKQHV